MCPGFLWFFSNDGWPEQSSLPFDRFVDLADIKMLWKGRAVDSLSMI